MICLSIVSHGQRDVALALLEDLLRLKPPSVSRIVYTANIDEPPLPVLDLGPVALEVIRNPVPRGFGQNHNAAFRHSRERFFCVMNPDLRLCDDPFPAMLGALEQDPGLGLVAPRILDPAGGLQNTARTLYTPLEMIRQKLRPGNAGERSDWLAGMFLLTRSDAFASIDGFDEGYFLYIEDVDFSSRLALAGWRLRQIPEACVTHDARKQSHRSWRYTRWHLAGMLRYWTGATFWRYLLAERPSSGWSKMRWARRATEAALASIAAHGGPVQWASARLRHLRRVGIKAQLRQVAKRLQSTDGSADAARYARWIADAEGLDAAALQAHPPSPRISGAPPRFSVLMPTYQTRPDHLAAAIESVLAQRCQDWELVIADDASTGPDTRRALAHAQAQDPRIRVHIRPENGHICQASNTALSLARGAFIVLLDHDDLLHPMALYWLAEAIDNKPGVELIFSDEDKIDGALRRSEPYFKSDLNPALLWSQNMVSHLGAYKKSSVIEIGGFREGFEGSQDHDLALRMVRHCGAPAIHHIPRVLYHWRRHAASTASGGAAKPYTVAAGCKAIDDDLHARGIAGFAEPAPEAPSMYRVRLAPPQPETLVDIFVLHDGRGDIKARMRAVTRQQGFDPRHILTIDTTASLTAARVESAGRHPPDQSTAVGLAPGHRLWQALSNSDAEYIIIVGAGITPIGTEGFAELLSWCRLDDVGIVGGRIWSHDDRLRRAGIALRPEGLAVHVNAGLIPGEVGTFGRAVLAQDFMAVSGEYCAARRDTLLAAAANGLVPGRLRDDVALGLTLHARGQRAIWTPYAQARSLDGIGETQADLRREDPGLVARWKRIFDRDPLCRISPLEALPSDRSDRSARHTIPARVNTE